MVTKIIALVIGILLAAAGIVFYAKEKNDPESRKIYSITAIVGIVIAVGAVVLLLM